MNLSKTKIAVIGAGRMGTLHLSKYIAMPNVEFAGIYDSDFARVTDIQSQFSVRVFENLEELLFEVDGVVIASPTPTHFAIAKKALQSGVHVLIEKPMCEKVSEALELEKLAKDNRLVCQVGFIERYRLQAMLKDHPIGSVRFIEAHRLAPSVGREVSVDVVSDLMIHDVDLALSLIGEEPYSISAIGVPVVTPHFDVANVRLEFPSGAIANLTASRIADYPQRKLRVFSTLRYCSMDFLGNQIDSYTRNDAGMVQHQKHPVKSIDALLNQCKAFVSAIQGQQRPVVTAFDGAQALKITELIREKIKERAAWKVSSFHKDVLGERVFQKEH